MIDFIIYFHPGKEGLKLFGIKKYFYFGEDGDGVILFNKGPFYIRSFFIKNYKKYLFFGVFHEKREVLLKIVREGLVDFVLNPPIDYTILKFCKENGVRVVASLKNFSPDKFKYLYNLVKIVEKMKVKVILTSEASKLDELIPKRVFVALLKELEIKPSQVKKYIEENAQELYRVCKLRKESTLPGVYIEKIS